MLGAGPSTASSGWPCAHVGLPCGSGRSHIRRRRLDQSHGTSKGSAVHMGEGVWSVERAMSVFRGRGVCAEEGGVCRGRVCVQRKRVCVEEGWGVCL